MTLLTSSLSSFSFRWKTLFEYQVFLWETRYQRIVDMKRGFLFDVERWLDLYSIWIFNIFCLFSTICLTHFLIWHITLIWVVSHYNTCLPNELLHVTRTLFSLSSTVVEIRICLLKMRRRTRPNLLFQTCVTISGPEFNTHQT